MRKSRLTETQIIGILKEVESGRTGQEVCREHGMFLAVVVLLYPVAHRVGLVPVGDIGDCHVRDNIPVSLLALAYRDFVEQVAAGSGPLRLNPSGYIERYNTDKIDRAAVSWDESAAWDEIADCLCGEAGG